MPLPVAHGMLGALAIILIRPRTSFRQDWAFLLSGAFLAITPDFDFFFVWILKWGEEWHRGFTHSIFWAVVFTVLIYLAKKFSDFRTVLALGAALLSHSLLDFLTTKFDMGVELLFPFSDERFKLGLIGYLEFTQDNSALEFIKLGLIELIVLLPIFLIILRVSGYLSKPSFTKSIP